MTSPRPRPRREAERGRLRPRHNDMRSRRPGLLSACLAMLFFASACSSSSSHPAPRASTPTPRALPAATLSSAAGARAHAEALLSRVRVPSAAVETRGAANRYLAAPFSVPVSPYLVGAHRIWTVPWALDETVRWYHRIGRAAASPRAMSPSASHGVLTAVSFQWSGVADDGVSLEIVPIAAHRTGIRADAQVIWAPPRPASETVPRSVAGAEVVAYYLPRGVVASRHVGAATARRLARLVDDLGRDTRGPHGCLADVGFRLRITFPTPSGHIVVSEFPACLSTGVTVDGQSEPDLLLGSRLEAATLKAVGLPAHYRPTSRR